jgi:hypothetical protein
MSQIVRINYYLHNNNYDNPVLNERVVKEVFFLLCCCAGAVNEFTAKPIDWKHIIQVEKNKRQARIPLQKLTTIMCSSQSRGYRRLPPRGRERTGKKNHLMDTLSM